MFVHSSLHRCSNSHFVKRPQQWGKVWLFTTPWQMQGSWIWSFQRWGNLLLAWGSNHVQLQPSFLMQNRRGWSRWTFFRGHRGKVTNGFWSFSGHPAHPPVLNFRHIHNYFILFILFYNEKINREPFVSFGTHPSKLCLNCSPIIIF